MAKPLAVTLRIALDMSHGSREAYRVLYTIRDEEKGEATPYPIHGQEALRAVLDQCALSPQDIDLVLTRVQSEISYVLDLGHMDTTTAERVLLSASGW